MTIILGAVSMGVLLASKQVMHQAAGEATRTAMLVASSQAQGAQPIDAAKDQVRSMLGSDACDPVKGNTCTILLNQTCGTATCVKVTLRRDLKKNPVVAELPILKRFLPTTMSAEASMRMP